MLKRDDVTLCRPSDFFTGSPTLVGRRIRQLGRPRQRGKANLAAMPPLGESHG
jgi:hypothetical protein